MNWADKIVEFIIVASLSILFVMGVALTGIALTMYLIKEVVS